MRRGRSTLFHSLLAAGAVPVVPTTLREDILADPGIFAFWEFEGNMNATVGAYNLTGSVSYDTGLSGAGQAAIFTGATQASKLTTDLRKQVFSIEAVFKYPATTAAVPYFMVLGKGPSSYTNGVLFVLKGASNEFNIFWRAGSPGNWDGWGGPFTRFVTLPGPNSYLHLVFTYTDQNGGDSYTYINGLEVDNWNAATAVGGPFSPAIVYDDTNGGGYGIYVGGAGDGGAGSPCTVDYIAYYDGVLSPATIATRFSKTGI